ncbi:FAD-linked sulfhydryl oxidase ERV2 [Absidia repens]|uniref:Sulfhydryl oxidase n=1 Tax=Absidia repens TaxID=90262 RepID=A0A1X2I6Z1_9FUNG|nr:FAD-linked sulfhydryl oxidase ERV2 [Absidia repens]
MKRNHLKVAAPCLLLLFFGICWFFYSTQHDSIGHDSILTSTLTDNNDKNLVWQGQDVSHDGGVVMAHLGNATAKAELGRSTWKLLHTMMSRYPEQPTADERTALDQFIHLLSRLYPCGECAEHFQKLLKLYPPQTSSRIAASQWACAVHNKVNERLGKLIFDCSDIEAKYPCGCESVE